MVAAVLECDLSEMLLILLLKCRHRADISHFVRQSVPL